MSIDRVKDQSNGGFTCYPDRVVKRVQRRPDGPEAKRYTFALCISGLRDCTALTVPNNVLTHHLCTCACETGGYV